MQKDVNKTKATILAIAAKLFAKNGYTPTSMNDIASQVKIEKASLYYFYKNKNDIFLAVIDDIWNGLKKEIEKIFKKSNGQYNKNTLNQVIEKMIYFGLKSGLTIIEINSHKIMKSRDCKIISSRINEVKELVVIILKNAKVKNPELAQEVIINAIHAYVIHAQNHKQTTKPAKYAAYLTSLFI